MKIIFLILVSVLLLNGCAINVRESYRNPDFNQKLDKISVKWIPPKEQVLSISVLVENGYRGYDISPFEKNDAMIVASKHINELKTRIPETLKKELLYYEADVVQDNLSSYLLLLAPQKTIEVFCKRRLCQSTVTMQLTLKERISETLIWSGTISVESSPPPFTRKIDRDNEEVVTRDTTKEFAESIVSQWNKFELLPPKLASPRVYTPLENGATADKATNLLVKTDVSYEVALTWIKENNKWGTSSEMVKDFQNDLDKAIGKVKAVWEIGWGQTKSGKAYRIEWTKDKLNITEYSPEKALTQGLKEMRKRFSIVEPGLKKVNKPIAPTAEKNQKASTNPTAL